MDSKLLTLEDEIIIYNKVKDLVIKKIVREGYMTEREADEFSQRNQVLLYKGTWFSDWFEKNVSTIKKEKESYYIRMIEITTKILIWKILRFVIEE